MRPGAFTGLAFDIGTATFSDYDADGFLGAEVDVYGGSDASVAPIEVHSPFGFLSRQLDPDASGLGCQVLYAWEGNRGHAFVLGDPRVTAKIPKLKKGGSVVFGATGTFDLIDGENGSKTLYVPYAFDGSGKAKKSMAITLDVSNPGAEKLIVGHGEGMAVVMLAEGKKLILKNAKGDACIILDDTGILLNGNITVNGMLNVGKALLALLTALGANTKPPTPVPTVLSLT